MASELSTTNTITLVAQESSSISNVNLYPNRAEVTRVFRFEIVPGQNIMKITKLPDFADMNSVRVEGKGPATIHDVSTTFTSEWGIRKTNKSPILEELRKKSAIINAAINRCKRAESTLEEYMESIKAGELGVEKLGDALSIYEQEGKKLYDTMTSLETALKEVGDEINLEEKRLDPTNTDNYDAKLRTVVTVNLQGESDGMVELRITYAVRDATWSAAYDIRAEVAEKESTIHITYRAIITQSTGEDWMNMQLFLETSTPTFGLEIPHISPWKLNVYQQKPVLVPPSEPQHMNFVQISSPRYSPASPTYSPASPQYYPTRPAMEYRVADVGSTGNVTATFRIPGHSDIPTDDTTHSVVITELYLKSVMSWACVPKKDSRVHLKAKITNSSDYALLGGPANVYVNGSFISKSKISTVSPEESFDCSLGVDPSIRVTYHPQIKKTTQAGFYNKTSTQVVDQRVSVFNTKQVSVTNLKILDQYPISEHQDIVVNILNPLLTPPEGLNNGTVRVSSPSKVTAGVIAQWNGADDDGVDHANLGRDGMFNWVCTIPPQGKVNLLLQYEVKAGVNTKIEGF